MRTIFTAIIILIFVFPLQAKRLKLKTGQWQGQLFLTQNDTLPFEVEIIKTNGSYQFSVINAEEKITLAAPRYSGDTLILDFPSFHSSLYFIDTDEKKLSGFWQNFNKIGTYRIPLLFTYGIKNCPPANFSNFDGKWKTIFDPESEDQSYANGLFNQKENKLSGTFRTETGDYRYLAGYSKNNKLMLSCFDGSHAFLFKADFKNDTLYGTFNSGSHHKGEWKAVKDANFELTHPDSLTFAKNSEFKFSVLDMTGKTYNFPEMATLNKITIIQIMGTWCPNCMDELKFYNKIYEQYHQQGMEIIAVAYEVGEDFNAFKAKVDLLQSRYNFPFQFYIGGKADKKLAASQFPDLNHVISFPTSIFLDENGRVIKIHTGFNGPGTGDVYKQYMLEICQFIESQLAN